jgi:hypothetical protein
MARRTHRIRRATERTSEHPPEIEERIRYESGPSRSTMAVYERQADFAPRPAPKGNARLWWVLGAAAVLGLLGTLGRAVWRVSEGIETPSYSGDVSWLLFVIAVGTLGRAWYLSE